MLFTEREKENIKRKLVASLSGDSEIVKIVIFGSFLDTQDPHDLDVAIFQTSHQSYLPLAMRYRAKTREIAQQIPLDILPIKANAQDGVMLAQIAKGEVIYER